MNSRPELLSIIVPVYNERATFSELINLVLSKRIDDVDIEIRRHIRFDGIQKRTKFLGAMTAMQLTDHTVGLQFQSSE